MRTTIDIPDSLYREIKMHAAAEGGSIREVILEGVEMRLAQRKDAEVKPFKVPIIRSKHPGTLNLTNEQIDDLTAFT